MKLIPNGSRIILSGLAAFVLLGCTKEPHPVLKSVESPKVEIADSTAIVSMSVSDMSVRKAIKSLCSANKLSCDQAVMPSDQYKITFNYNGPIDGIFPIIKRQTGVDYKFIDGVLSVANQDGITLYNDPLKKESCSSEIAISFKDTKVKDVFKYFHDQYGYSFVFDTRNVSPSQDVLQQQGGLAAPLAVSMPVNNKGGSAQKALRPMPPVTFYYNGCDPKEALKAFLLSVDFAMNEAQDGQFTIRDYDVALVDKSVYFNYTLGAGAGASSSGGQTSGVPGRAGAGGSSASSSGASSSSDNSSSTVSLSENHRSDLESLLRHYLSSDGKLDFSMRGFLVVEDRPSYVSKIKKIIKKEIEKETPLHISINIIRVDLKDNYKAGVDWNAIIQDTLGGFSNIGVSISKASLVGGGASIKGTFKGTDQILSMLQEYGNTKIERSSTINARSGFLANYEATKPIPYITTGSTISGGTAGFAQSSITPQFEKEGIVLNILPNINVDNKMVDLGVDVTVSEYAGDKAFDLGTQGTYSLPIIPKDKGHFAVQATLGETVILTGFKVKKGAVGKTGVPWLSQVTGIGALFGYQEDLDESSEILIVLKVDQVKS